MLKLMQVKFLQLLLLLTISVDKYNNMRPELHTVSTDLSDKCLKKKKKQ